MQNQSTNYKFRLPIITADDTTWGNDFSSGDPAVDPSPGLNGNWTKMDLLLQMQRDKIAELQGLVDDIPDFIDGLRIQVGGIYATTDGTDPATILGYGTWEPWGLGRALISEGTSDRTWTNEEEAGSETHQLTVDEIPIHSHDATFPATDSEIDGDHTHSYTGRGGTVTGDTETGTRSTSSGTKTSTSVGNHSHSFTMPAITTGDAGGDTAHENVMPSKACYLWKRTA